MAIGLRKCKECGKTFLPKGREQYCSDIHYRPCPICGDLVEVKYLSDPPRKCSKCRHIKVKSLTGQAPSNLTSISKAIVKNSNQSCELTQLESEPETVLLNKKSDRAVDNKWMKDVDIIKCVPTDSAVFCEHVDGTVMVYIGKQFKNGFIPGHQYLLKVEKTDYVYRVSSTEDISAGESCDILIPYASQISFYQSFGKLRDHSAGKGHTC